MLYACLDLGSNSFHLLIARHEHGAIEVIERVSEKVQLAEGIASHACISPQAWQRGLDCLQRFKSLLLAYPVGQCLILGTNALRVASNAAGFVEEAGKLGFDITVVSGTQEAVLVYLGVISALPDSDEGRLVIDIGGGSTELIVGRGRTVLWAHSFEAGCVTWRDRFFSPLPQQEDELQACLDTAIAAARDTFEPQLPLLASLRWSHAYASSGTAKMLAAVCEAHGLGEGEISLEALRQLRPELIRCTLAGELLSGLSEARRDLLLPGWALLFALMQCMQLQCVRFSATALREGMLDVMMRNAEAGRAADFLGELRVSPAERPDA